MYETQESDVGQCDTVEAIPFGREDVMSISTSVEASAEDVIEFGHGGMAEIKLSTLHEGFPQERLEKVLAASRRDTTRDLEVMSHASEVSGPLSVKYPKREFSLVFSGIHFNLEVVVTVGGLNAPIENVYHLVQTWVLTAVIHFCGLDVQARTGVPVCHQALLEAGRQLTASALVCVNLAVRDVSLANSC